MGLLDKDIGEAGLTSYAVTDGNFLVADGTEWGVESGATARTSMGVGTTDTVQLTKLGLGVAPAVPFHIKTDNTPLDDTLEIVRFQRGTGGEGASASGSGLTLDFYLEDDAQTYRKVGDMGWTWSADYAAPNAKFAVNIERGAGALKQAFAWTLGLFYFYDDDGDNNLILNPTGCINADRTLTVQMDDEDRQISFSGAASGEGLDISGASAIDQDVTTTGSPTFASGVTIGTLTLASNSITDSSGAIQFGNEHLSTTGALQGTTVAGTIAVAAGTLALSGGSITDSSGAISFGNESLTTTGTINASGGKVRIRDDDTSKPTEEDDGYISVYKNGADIRIYTWVNGVRYYAGLTADAEAVPGVGNPIGLLLALTYAA